MPCPEVTPGTFFSVFITGSDYFAQRQFGIRFSCGNWGGWQEDGYDRTYDEKEYFTWRKADVDGRETMFGVRYEGMFLENWLSFKIGVGEGPFGIILYYDITRRETFEALDSHYKRICELLEEMDNHLSDGEKRQRRIPVAVCGDNCDRSDKRMVETEEGRKYAASHGWLFFEVSARANIDMEKPFYALVHEYDEGNNNNKEDEKGEKKSSKRGRKCTVQ